ncbi:hypothetical protein Q428_15245, partial [Fervidicella metallireducens AeB]
LRAQWLERIKAYKASGLTQAAFCKENNLNIKQLSYWVRKYRNIEQEQKNNSDESQNWLALDIKNNMSQTEKDVINVRVGKAVVEIKPGFDKNHLLNLLKVLETLC